MAKNLKALVEESTDANFLDAVAKGALKMNDKQISTVSFVFWLIYMIETGMDEANKGAWLTATKGASPEEVERLKQQMLAKMGKVRPFDVQAPRYFSQQVQIYEAIHGITEDSRFLRKIHALRNDLSHRRIEDLKYNGEPLSVRQVKEKILLDYFEFSTNPDLSKADFWEKMSEAEKEAFRSELDKMD